MEEIKINNDFDNSHNKNNNGTTIVIIGSFVLLALIIAIVVGFSGNGNGSNGFSNYLTYSNYTQIQNGMTYSEVVEILDGHDGVLDTSSGFGGYTFSYYTWSNNSGTKCIVIGFENGKVCSKSQYGLR